MSHTIEEIFAEAVELQENDRAALAGMLLHSLEPSPDARMDDAWVEEIKRRIDVVWTSGEVKDGSVGGSARTLVGALRLSSLASDYFRPPRKMRNELTSGTPHEAASLPEAFWKNSNLAVAAVAASPERYPRYVDGTRRFVFPYFPSI